MALSFSNPQSAKTSLQLLVQGLRSSMPPGVTKLVIEGKSLEVGAVADQLESYLAAYVAVDEAEAARRQCVRDRYASEIGAKTLAAGVEIALRGLLGTSSPSLEKFGVKPATERKPLTGEQIVAKAAKARATREARHTMGSRQKLAVKGDAANAANAAEGRSSPSAPPAAPGGAPQGSGSSTPNGGQ